MKFVRLAALFGSVILLVATVTSLINARAELGSRRDERVEAAAAVARLSVEATVLRARAVVGAASSITPPAELTASFNGAADACIELPDGDLRCSGADLTQLDAYASAATAAAQRPAETVAIAGSGYVLVAAHRDSTVTLRIGLDALVGPAARADIARFETELRVAGTTGQGDELGLIDGRSIAASTIAEPFDEGSVVASAAVASGVGWGAGSPGVYGTLLALGTVLLGFAAWSFLSERRQLERRATTDELTGLVNRREFERESDDAIEMAGRMNLGLCIMLIDLNGFKQINDNLGHQVGDLVLKTCADRLRDAVRDTDLVGRWGGDEFVVLLPGLEDASAVRDSAERISASLSASPAAGDVTITGSIGAALFPRHGRELEDLMHAADEAMYEAKTAGVGHRLAETIPTTQQLAPPSYLGPERRRAGAHAPDADHVANH